MHVCVYIYMYIYMLLDAREGFLGYLKALKKSMDERSGFDVGEKALMCLSSETVEGLHITGINE